MTLVTYPLRAVVLCALWLLAGPAVADVPPAADGRFTVAVIPDSQNYLDYKHQRATGFPIDAAEMFHDQVDYIARNVESAGGEIAFVTHVGDVWQHAMQGIDAAHLAMGLREDPESIVVRYYAPDPRALTVEARAARDVFTKLADRVPFSVVISMIRVPSLRTPVFSRRRWRSSRVTPASFSISRKMASATLGSGIQASS